MAIEAELKARVRDPGRVRALLATHAVGERSVYRDVYYDTPDSALDRDGREMRVRVIEVEDRSQCLLTFKEPAVDRVSGSKPEYEVTVGAGGADDLDAILCGMGLAPAIALTKHCTNYRFTADDGRTVLATVVTVPELDDTFLEVETLTESADLVAALDTVRAVLTSLGIGDDDLTTELYTDAVRRSRGRASG
jgi:adenylate cyclase, class 2